MVAQGEYLQLELKEVDLFLLGVDVRLKLTRFDALANQEVGTVEGCDHEEDRNKVCCASLTFK